MVVLLAVPRSSAAAPSLALPHRDYPRAAQVVVLPSTNAEADQYFGPVHRSSFNRLRRLDGAGWIQAALWHFTTGRGGAIRNHQTIFAYGIHLFKGRKGARGALADIKLKWRPTRVDRLYARTFRSSDARETLEFLFFPYHEVLVETYYEYHGTAPAAVASSLQQAFTTQATHLARLARKLDRSIHHPPTPTVAPSATATATATLTPTATATATAPPTTTPSPTATPPPPATFTPTATPIPRLAVTLSTSSATYAAGGPVTVTAHVTLGSQPVAGADVSMTFDFPGEASLCATKTDAKGNASCTMTIPSSTPAGRRVDVEVAVQAPNGMSDEETAAFTVQGSG